MTKRMVVKNLAQAVLFENEIKGQLSDGNWENATPWGHYKAWCDCTVQVGEHIGRNFYPVKDNYGLHGLIKYVGERMQFKGALATLYPEEVAMLMAGEYPAVPDSATDMLNYIKWAATEEVPQYYSRVVGRWHQAGLTTEKIERTERKMDKVYPMKQLRKDLTTIKKAMKARIG